MLLYVYYRAKKSMKKLEKLNRQAMGLAVDSSVGSKASAATSKRGGTKGDGTDDYDDEDDEDEYEEDEYDDEEDDKSVEMESP